jgi:hypothetical protein
MPFFLIGNQDQITRIGSLVITFEGIPLLASSTSHAGGLV